MSTMLPNRRPRSGKGEGAKPEACAAKRTCVAMPNDRRQRRTADSVLVRKPGGGTVRVDPTGKRAPRGGLSLAARVAWGNVVLTRRRLVRGPGVWEKSDGEEIRAVRCLRYADEAYDFR